MRIFEIVTWVRNSYLTNFILPTSSHLGSEVVTKYSKIPLLRPPLGLSKTSKRCIDADVTPHWHHVLAGRGGMCSRNVVDPGKYTVKFLS